MTTAPDSTGQSIDADDEGSEEPEPEEGDGHRTGERQSQENRERELPA